MAAREDEAEPLVGNRFVVHRLRLDGDEQLRLSPQRRIAAHAVDRAVACDRHEPSRRIRRNAVARPPLERDSGRILEDVLGEVEVAENADQGGEDAAVLLAEELLELRQALTSA
jgi:hypothetical protein